MQNTLTWRVFAETVTFYRIAGKFGGENVWRTYSFQTFGGKKFSESIDQPKDYSLNYYFEWF